MPIVPIALTVLGVLYDVGYFTRIGVDLFTLFSLSEHLLFAIQAVPFLLVAIAVTYLLIATFYLVEKKKLAGLRAAERKKRKTQLRYLNAAVSLGLGLISFFLAPRLRALSFAFFYLAWAALVTGRSQPYIRWIGGLIGVLLAAFALGYTMASWVLEPEEEKRWPWGRTVTISIADEPPITRQVLRSGQRGPLVFNALDGTVQLKPWNEVRGIEVPFNK